MNPSTSDILVADDLGIAVPGRVLVDRFDLHVSAGEFCALLGGNGAGKSLLLRTLAGLRPPQNGRVLVAGRAIGEYARRDVAAHIGFLPQDPDASPQGILHESVLLGRFAHLGLWDATSTADRTRVITALRHTGLAELAGREVATLSGGEQRRAAIARLLVQAPSVYLLDEPTNHLDPAQQIALLDHFRALTREGAAVVASLHDPNLALRFADRVCLLSGNGAAESVDCAALDAHRLERLYGVRFEEGRIGAHRLFTAA